MSRRNPAEIIASLIHALGSSVVTVQHEAVQLIHTIAQDDNQRELVIEMLVASLAAPNPRLQIHVIETLSLLQATEAFDGVAVFAHAEDKLVRNATIGALCRLDAARGLPYAVAALNDPAWEVRRAGVQMIGETEDHQHYAAIVALLDDEAKWVRTDTANALAKLGSPRAVPQLITALRDDDWQVRRASTNALVAIGRPAVKSLLSTLPHEGYDTQIFVIEALGRIGDHSAATLICAMLDASAHIQTRRTAARALSMMRTPEAVIPLLAQLHQPDLPLRLHVIAALGGIGAQAAAEPLLALLDDDNLMLRLQSHKALLNIADNAVDALTKWLHSNNTHRQHTAWQLLAAIGTDRARAAVEQWRGDDRG